MNERELQSRKTSKRPRNARSPYSINTNGKSERLYLRNRTRILERLGLWELQTVSEERYDRHLQNTK
jgi:hypothetical protein